MLSENFAKYLNEGQSLFFACFHFLMILIPAVFYGLALFLLLRHRKNGILTKKQTGKRHKSASKTARTEARLIIPCILNSIVFLIGQIAITLGTGEGKWATFAVLILFAVNSAVNPVLLLMFSAVIREKVIQFFRPGKTCYLLFKITHIHRAAETKAQRKFKQSGNFNRVGAN
jgi:cytochrome bd-type quinol oxidase subunit 2